MRHHLGLGLLSSLLLGSSGLVHHLQAHPLQAEPVDHAYVFTFDQNYLIEDPDEHLIDGGYLLLAELNCTACHSAPKEWQARLAPKAAPDLSEAGSRLDADSLWLMVRSPQYRKKGTQMPGLFAGEPGDAEKVEALTEYLSSLKGNTPAMPKGNAEAGKELYHRVGCVACHDPASDFRPAKAASGTEPEKPTLGSIPIALADAYDEKSLAAFLYDPLRHRPAGRMPNMRLSKQEAADVAAYLHTGRTVEVAAERAALKIPRQGIEKGRQLFLKENCVACHRTKESPDFPAPTAKSLKQVALDKGCMAEKQGSGVPRFDLNGLEKRALRLALTAIQSGKVETQTAKQKVDWHMSRLNCYACHDRDNKGGPEVAREQYFTTNDPGAESLGQLGHLPPNLDHVGRKLTKTWFEKILWGEDGSVRPYLDSRMPNFGRKQTEPLIELFAQADKPEKAVEIDVTGLQKHHRSEIGRKLIGATGLACVSCHGLKDRKSLGPPVIRLTHAVERLLPEYFKELLLNPQATQPGTMMPPLFLGRKNADKDIESLWTYLRELDGQPLPEGLLSNEDFELKPEKGERPIVFRSFIEGAGSHAIAIGFPKGIHAAFDPVSCRWRIAWRGRFLDAMSNWQSREMKPIAPLGTDVKSLPDRPALSIAGKPDAAALFEGYRLDAKGVPTMLYKVNGKRVEDRLEPSPDGKSFQRTIRIQGKTDGLLFTGLTNNAEPVVVKEATIKEVLSW